MAQTPEDLQSFVEVMVRPLLDHPEDLEISVEEPEDASVLLELKVHPDDAGKVIGRQGRIIQAIRTLVRASAARDGLHVNVEIIN